MFKYTFVTLLSLIILTFVLLQFSAVQTYIAQKVSKSLSERVDHEITIERVEINWFDDAVLKNVTIKDPQKEEMIFIEELDLDFKFTSLLSNPIVIEEATLIRPHIHLIKNSEGVLNLNNFINTMRNSFKKKKKKKRKNWVAFTVLQINMNNGEFSYNDLRKPKITEPGRFDYNHFAFDSIYVSVDSLYIRKDTFNINAHHLSAIQRKLHLPIKDLSTRMRLNRSKMEFGSLSADIGSSHISDLIRFEYNHIRQMNYFNDSVNIVTHLDSTVFYSKDLAVVAPSLIGFEDYWRVSGTIEGKMSKFKASDLSLQFGDRSNLKGEIKLTGIPNVLNTEMRIAFEDSHIYPEDIRQYLGVKQYAAEKKFGKIDLDARFDGFPTDFVAYGNFTTELGSFSSDLRFKIDEEDDLSNYSGHLKTTSFDLGHFLEKKQLGKIDMSGQVVGHGFNIENGRINMDAKIQKFDLFGYRYRNIVVDGELKNAYFNGYLKVNDKNLKLQSRGKVDLRPGQNIFRVKTTVDTANLMQLGITDDTAFFRSTLDLGFQGLTIDEIVGRGKLENTVVQYQGRKLRMNDFNFESSKSDSNRKFNVNSSYFDFHSNGNFEFNTVYQDAKNLLEEYLLLLKNNEQLTREYYAQKRLNYSPKRYSMAYDISINDLNPLTGLFAPDVEISNNTYIEGSFHNGESARLTFTTSFDKLIYHEHTFENNTVEISASKLIDSTAALASFLITSDQQRYYDRPNTTNLFMTGVWTKNNINFNTQIKQYEKTNYANLSGNMNFYKDSSIISLDPSDVSLVNQLWNISEDNRIVLTEKGKEIEIYNLNLFNGDQKIILDGAISENPEKSVTVAIQNFDLLNIEPIINTRLEGRFTGSLTAKDLYNQINFTSEVDVQDFTIEGIEVGHIDGNLDWLRDEQYLQIGTNLFSDSSIVASVFGKYDPKQDINDLDIKVVFKNTNIKILEPYLQGQVEQLVGSATGLVFIKGTIHDPTFFGQLKVNNASFKISYLNTKYYFNDYVHFSYDSISVKNLVVQDSLNYYNIDKKGHTAVLNGGLTHRLFKEFKVNIDVAVDRCLLLDTKAGDNDLYYGKAIGTGFISVHGTFSDLYIDSKALTSNRGTNITIPTSSDATITQQSYITYVNVSKIDSTTIDSIEKTVGPTNSNITMNFNLNITRDAQLTVIYDEEVFYIKEGYGDLTLGITTRDDEFTMDGMYTIQEGAYNFKFANIIDKKFKAKPGGTIRWDGDPYEGTIDITAYYVQNTKLLPIFDTSIVDASSAEVNKPYPVTVLMHLKDRLLSPDITFDIEFNDYPNTVKSTSGSAISTNDFLKTFDRRIQDDEQELNRQVFSLMVLQQLSPENSFQGGDVSGNVTELIANQFSAWLSQVDENVEIDIDLNSLDEDALQSLRFRLSVEALDGKIRITRDGGFTNVDNSANLNSLMGDVTVEYMITSDGRLRLKAYNKTNQNTISTSLQNNNNQLYGASIMYTQSFNNLNDLIKRKKKDKEK